TGLLILGVNSSTRLLTYLVGLDKEYLATIRLGSSTPTDDADSPADRQADPSTLAAVSGEAIRAEILRLTGTIRQVPSAVSAIKVDGRRSYARVRAGEEVKLAPRTVIVSEFDALAMHRDAGLDVDVRVRCSSGTYVRALARDIGVRLGVGGHLTALRRMRIGEFDVRDSSALDELDVASVFLSPTSVAEGLFPVLRLTEQQAGDLSHGKRVSVEVADGAPVAAITAQGSLAGLVEISDGVARVLVNFPEDEVA
ncbi:MAG: tRNA pseudouridine(55) synthase TruB, partial [Terrimesophilobacter sp.]